MSKLQRLAILNALYSVPLPVNLPTIPTPISSLCQSPAVATASVVNVRSAARASDHSVRLVVHKDDPHRLRRLIQDVRANIGRTHVDVTSHEIQLVDTQTGKPIGTERQLDRALASAAYKPHGVWLEYRVEREPLRKSAPIPEYKPTAPAVTPVRAQLTADAPSAALPDLVCASVGQVAAEHAGSANLRSHIGAAVQSHSAALARLGMGNVVHLASMIATDLHHAISAATVAVDRADKARAYTVFARRSPVWSVLEEKQKTEQAAEMRTAMVCDELAPAAEQTRGKYFMPSHLAKVNPIVFDDTFIPPMQRSCPHEALNYKPIGAETEDIGHKRHYHHHGLGLGQYRAGHPHHRHGLLSALLGDEMGEAETEDIGKHRHHHGKARGHYKGDHPHHRHGLLSGLLGDEMGDTGEQDIDSDIYSLTPNEYERRDTKLVQIGSEAAPRRDTKLVQIGSEAAPRRDTKLVQIGSEAAPRRDTKLVQIGSEAAPRRDSKLVPIGSEAAPRRDTKLVPIGSEAAPRRDTKLIGPEHTHGPLHALTHVLPRNLSDILPVSFADADKFGREYSEMMLYNRLEKADHSHAEAVVVVDGKEAGRIAYGCNKSIPILEGRHTVEVRADSGEVMVPSELYTFVSNRVYPCVMMPGQKRLFVSTLMLPRLPHMHIRGMISAGKASVLAQTSHGVRVSLVDDNMAEHELAENAYTEVPVEVNAMRIYDKGSYGHKPLTVDLTPGNAYTVAAGKNATGRVWTHVVEDRAHGLDAAKAQTATAAASDDQFNFMKNKK